MAWVDGDEEVGEKTEEGGPEETGGLKGGG